MKMARPALIAALATSAFALSTPLAARADITVAVAASMTGSEAAFGD